MINTDKKTYDTYYSRLGGFKAYIAITVGDYNMLVKECIAQGYRLES